MQVTTCDWRNENWVDYLPENWAMQATKSTNITRYLAIFYAVYLMEISKISIFFCSFSYLFIRQYYERKLPNNNNFKWNRTIELFSACIYTSFRLHSCTWLPQRFFSHRGSLFYFAMLFATETIVYWGFKQRIKRL